MSSTAVFAYADFLPDAFDLGVFDIDVPHDNALPHVARQVAHGEPLRIVAFGSSSTEGIGASTPAAAYPARLEAVLKGALPHLSNSISVLNRGIGGEAVDEMLARLDRDVIREHPDLVIWQTGSNDALRGISLDHFREETESAVRRIREAGIDVVLMEPQWCPRFDATPGAYRFRDAVRQIGVRLDVPVIRRSSLMRDWIARAKLTHTELFSADGLHMADRGYDLLAQAAAEDVLRAAAVPVAD
ncbi:SGNH/GDSL hydrolase family protein [Methylobacterium sp. C25]|uniref:SGNH/GDSL hydrolase family protein n=1 Tax=Methylobacterium sp. C25 TaxID=2721622 RepID=UPI002D7FDF65|nr:GDSL-type esterase/lipase family protein [Methylobacterium sp. C25]MCE4226551.1 SGNH/GDSL hydrolase family protein [Methylobacterium sp. C25]